MISAFWLVSWAMFLSWCWLLPNHYLPWSAFHMDAWAAAMYLPVAAAVLWRTRADVRVTVSSLVVLVAMTIPWVQYACGMILSSGTVWMPFVYLMGFALAIVVGQKWEAKSPHQVGDGLFMAIGFAAVMSIGLQLHQWLQINWIDIWSMGNGHGRPYANIGQPNQLGTLLLWGLLALAWGAWRAQIRPIVVIFAAIFILFGLALTASRTAWIGILALAAAIWYWRALWPWRALPWVASGLTACYFCFVWIIPIATQHLLLASTEADLEALVRISSETRPQIWAMFIEAIKEEPLLGYGWNQVSVAHLSVATDHPPLGILFSHAHNLFLDLLLWNGIPIGFALSVFIILWTWRRFRSIQDPGSALMFLLWVVVGNHAMLEFPLHYAYFLLPIGLVVGALDIRLGGLMVVIKQRWPVGLLWLASAMLLTLLVRDYLRVEAGYQALRYEWAKIRTNASREPPDVLLLDQLRDVIVLDRFEPSFGMKPEQLDWMRRVATLYPSAGSVHKLAVALVWNNQPDEATLWLRRMCAVVPARQCLAIKSAWDKQAKTDPLIARVPWPN